MTAITMEAAQAVRVPKAPARPVPLSRIVRVELRKMFDTRSGFWLMASIVITSVLATGAVILFAPDDQLTYSTFGSAIGFPIAVILPIVALLSVTSEWSQRSGLTTFTLVPHRGRVILAKGITAVGVGIVSMLVAVGIGALGNLAGTAITGTDTVWNISFVEVLNILLGNVLGLLIGFVLGLLFRNSAAALVAYFVISFMLTLLTTLLAANQEWFRDVQPWVDWNYAQGELFTFEGALTGEQWAHLGVTSAAWLLVPLVVGLRLVMRSEVK